MTAKPLRVMVTAGHHRAHGRTGELVGKAVDGRWLVRLAGGTIKLRDDQIRPVKWQGDQP